MTSSNFVGCSPFYGRRRSRSCSTVATKPFTLIGLPWYASNPDLVALERQYVPHELAALVVVLDDEDQLTRHGAPEA
jgi:hypothetical protein